MYPFSYLFGGALCKLIFVVHEDVILHSFCEFSANSLPSIFLNYKVHSVQF